MSEADGHKATPHASGRIQTALERYERGSITLPRAAELAGVSIYEMIAILEERRIPYRYDLSDLEEYVKKRHG
jgi:predicted HTH domain antitoxin